jgi:2-phosphosulfolactate phosphatase
LLWAASFLVAPATVVALQASGAKRVAFIVTGTVHYNSADEDLACAEWMGRLLQGNPTPVDPYLQRVRDSVAAATFLEPGSPLYAPSDVDFCARAGIFPFSLKAEAGDKGLVLRSAPTEQGIGLPIVQSPL